MGAYTYEEVRRLLPVYRDSRAIARLEEATGEDLHVRALDIAQAVKKLPVMQRFVVLAVGADDLRQEDVARALNEAGHSISRRSVSRKYEEALCRMLRGLNS